MTPFRWGLVALMVAMVLGTTSCFATKPGTSAGYLTITGEELQAKIDAGKNLTIVDLREPELYRAGHIPNAKNIPFEQFNERANELKSNDEIVLVCHTGPMGDVSGSLLAERGYAKIWNVEGGMARWTGKLAK